MNQLELFDKYISTGHDSALNDLIESFIPLARYWTSKYYLPNGSWDDLMQEALIGVYLGIKSYHSEMASRSSFNSFISMCIVRKIISAVKRSRRQYEKALNESISLEFCPSDRGERTLKDTIGDIQATPEELAILEETSMEWDNALSRCLSPFEAMVIKAFAAGYTYEEIAEVLGKNKKAVDNALLRARGKLVRNLEKPA